MGALINATLKMSIWKTNIDQALTFAHAKLLEFHILELKILNSLIQYKFLTCGHFPCYGLPHVILMPAKVTQEDEDFESCTGNNRL